MIKRNSVLFLILTIILLSSNIVFADQKSSYIIEFKDKPLIKKYIDFEKNINIKKNINKNNNKIQQLNKLNSESKSKHDEIKQNIIDIIDKKQSKASTFSTGCKRTTQ